MRKLIEGDPLYDNAVIQENGEMRGLMIVEPNTVSCYISDDTVRIDARVETYVVSAEYGELAICSRVFFVFNEYVNENTINQYETLNNYYVIYPIVYKSYKHLLKNSQYAKALMMKYIDEYFLQYSKSGRSWDEFIKDAVDKEIEEYKKTETMEDNVNHPDHYTWLRDKCGIEVIDITRHMNFDLGNAIKYILRAGKKCLKKDERQAKIEDLQKAVWYINDEIERCSKNQTK